MILRFHQVDELCLLFSMSLINLLSELEHVIGKRSGILLSELLCDSIFTSLD